MRTTNLTGSHNLGVFSRTVCAALLSCALTIALSGCKAEITEPVYPDDTASSSTDYSSDDLNPSRSMDPGEADANYQEGFQVIGQSFSVLPSKWFLFFGIPAAIILIAGIIKSLLG